MTRMSFIIQDFLRCARVLSSLTLAGLSFSKKISLFHRSSTAIGGSSYVIQAYPLSELGSLDL